MNNILWNGCGMRLNTSDFNQYYINKVIIFKDNQYKIISRYFLDNLLKFEYHDNFIINGDVKRKLKEDLTLDCNFVMRNNDSAVWDDPQYTLYINGDLNDYKFEGLQLIGDELDVVFYINNYKSKLCIGWNNKESSKYEYSEFQKAYDDIKTYNIDDVELDDKIKRLANVVKKYRKAKEIEKTYTIDDYKKMAFGSSIEEDECITILKNNGFDVKGL